MLSVVALLLGIVWLALFVSRIGRGGDWFDTWWPLVSGVAFVTLGVERLLRTRRTRRS